LEIQNNHKTSSAFEIPCLLVAKERFFRTPRLHHPLPTKLLPRFRVRPAVFRSSLAHHHYANSNSKLSNIISNDIPVMQMDFHRAMVSIPKGSIASLPKNFVTTLLVDHHRRTFVVTKPVEDRHHQTSVAAKLVGDHRRKTSVVVNSTEDHHRKHFVEANPIEDHHHKSSVEANSTKDHHHR
jgi:hypothetical protein